MNFHGTKLLVGTYVAVSILTLAAIVVLRNHPDLVTDAVWVRATIVVLSSALTAMFTAQAAKGSRGAISGSGWCRRSCSWPSW